MVSWERTILVGTVLTRRFQAILVLLTLPDLPGDEVAYHSVSPVDFDFMLGQSNKLAIELQPSLRSCYSGS